MEPVMEPFRLCIALCPLAAYFLLLGLLNLSRRPWLTTGSKDLALLAAAVAGLAVVGPMELFMPQAAVDRFGIYVWALLLAFYGLVVSFIALLARPKLIIYNITFDELRPVLGELVGKLDSDARWAGDGLLLPNLGVQLHVDGFPSMRNISLVASGDRQSFAGWRKLELTLAESLRGTQVQFNPRGLSMVTFAVLLIALCLIHGLGNKQALVQGFHDLLNR